ncbi:hypothetical protein JCM8097_001586 [Rhodosporidiobolus ruineniae]
MNTATAASIWSRLPNVEQEKLPSSSSHTARGISPSARSASSTSSHSHPSQQQPQRTHLAPASTCSHPHHLAHHHPTLDFNPSPRSSISSASFNSPTPDSRTSPRDRLASSTQLAPPPPPPHSSLIGPGNSSHQPRRSPPTGYSLSLYTDSALSNGAAHPQAHTTSTSTGSITANGVTAPALTGYLSPPPTTQPSSTSSPSSGTLLAEIFSGNPRPQYRPPPLHQNQQQQPGQPNYSTPSPRSDGTPALLSPPIQPESRSYFAAPAHGRARSQSSAPTFDNPVPPPLPHSNSMSGYGSGFPSSSSAQQHRASIAAPGAPPSSRADEHGYRPSSTLPSGGMHFSASLPTTSAVGSPSRSSLRELGPSPSHHNNGYNGASSGYSPFGPSLSRTAVDEQTGWRASGGGNGLSHSFSAGWNDDPYSGSGAADREGRSRFRDQWGSSANGGGGGGGGGGAGAVLSSSASSAGTGGIGMSNMSPFTRDGGRQLVDLPPAGSGAFGDTTWGSLGGGGGLGAAGGVGGGGAYRARRDYSLGAVGTGRKRSDSAWGRGERLKDIGDEDDEHDGAADDVFAPPTRSGATSRRHSFAAFDPLSRPSSSTTTQIGFHLPEDGGRVTGGSGGGGFGPLLQPGGPASNGFGGHGGGSSAINDDDLAADLNSLHLNLEAHVAAGEPSRFSHVGSVPVDFPPARGSRLDSSRSPEPLPPSLNTSLPPPVPSTTSGTSQFGHPSTSPRATAEPFTPSSAAASRFLRATGAAAPLPPTTTPATATASTGPMGSSLLDFGGPFSQPPNQQRYGRFGPNVGGLPPPVPPPQTQHQYYTPAPPGSGPLSPRGGMNPPLPPPAHHASPFPSFGQPSPGLPPPPLPSGLHALQTGYFAPPPPPSVPTAAPSSYMSSVSGGAPALTTTSQSDMNLGRGVPLHAIPPDAHLCIVGFKAGRKDLFFVEDPNLILAEGDLVIVEADRGRDIGKYLKQVTVDEVHKFQQHLVELALGQLANPNAHTASAGNGHGAGLGGLGSLGSLSAFGGGPGGSNSAGGGGGGQGGGQAGPAQLARMTKEMQPKRIYAKAGPQDHGPLVAKVQDEVKALALVRSKVLQKGLPMEVIDAEWQYDRRKLTFYYTAEQRVDFRELVRELFRIWKTRVWLCCLDQQQPSLDF